MSACLRRTLLASTIASLATSPLWAEEGASSADMVVTAAGFEQQLTDAPASISVISREQLERRQYRDVTDALIDIPGVIVTGGAQNRDISIRGMPAEYTLILVDGRPQNTRATRPNGSAGFEQDWLPPLPSIERIEVVRGPMSTLYGSDAIGGVINVITRKVAREWQGNVQLSTEIQQDSDSGDRRQGNFYLNGPLIEDRLGLQLYGRATQRDEDDIVNGYAGKSLQSLTARLSLAASENHDITAEVGRTEQDRESLVGHSAAAEGCRGECTDSFNDHTRQHFALTHSGRFDWGTSETFAEREHSRNDSRDIEITNTRFKSSAVVPLGEHMLTLGGSYEAEELEDGTTNRISDRTQIDNSQWALFVEDEWLVTDTVALTGGLRMDKDENFGSHVSPRLYSVWSMTPTWTLKGGVSTGFRSPTLREITPDWGQVSRGGNIYGNPDLTPETSVNKELALLYAGDDGLNASLTLFHNNFDDKITRVGCPIDICTDGPNSFGSDPTYRVNVDEAITQGAEASLAMPLSDALAFSASYTFTDSEQKSGENAGKPLNQLPRHAASASLDWQVNSRLSQWTKITYRGEQSEPTGGRSARSTVAPSYTFVDAGIGYQLNDSATLNAGIYNLMDESITYDEYGYVEDGRRLWLGLQVDF